MVCVGEVVMRLFLQSYSQNVWFLLVFHSFATLLVDSGVGKQRSNDEWKGWCLGGFHEGGWEAPND